MTQEIKEYLENAESEVLNEVLQLLIRRFSELYPEEECVWLALPRRNMEQRQRILRQLVSLLEKETQT